MKADLAAVLTEIRRRRVFKTGAIYAAAAWLLVQVAGEVVPALYLPERTLTVIVVLSFVGFPVTLVLAWAFDIGPDGIVRTKPSSIRGVGAILFSAVALVGATALFVGFIVPDRSNLGRGYDFEAIDSSVAVLPFTNMSPDETQDYFGDGIADVLIHRLAQIKRLHVIARTSSFAFKDKNLDMRDIGKALNVTAILEGSVQRSDGKLRIAAQLIDARTGAHIWSKLFDRRDEDIFEVQDDIAIEVTRAMVQEISPGEESQLTRQLTDDLQAYDLYLLGQHQFWRTWDYEKALEFYERAVETDPDFALAWTGLAEAHMMLIDNAQSGDHTVEQAREHIDRALDLDPTLGEAYTSEIHYYNFISDIDAARRSFEKAVEYSPNNVHSYTWFGNLLTRAGLLAESEQVLERALALNPLHPNTKANLSWTYMEQGKYPEARRLSNEMYTDGNFEEEHRYGYLAYLAMGAAQEDQFDEAVAYAHLALSGADAETEHFAATVLTHAFLVMEDNDRVNHWFGRMQGASGEDFVRDIIAARAYALSGNEAALRKLADDVAEIADANPVGMWQIWTAVAGELKMLSGEYAAAADFLQGSLSESARLEWYVWLAFSQQQIGEDDQAAQTLAQAEAIATERIENGMNSSWFRMELISLRAAQGDTEQTIAQAEHAFNQGSLDHTYLEVYPLFNLVRDDPRFIAVIDGMKQGTAEKLARVNHAYATGEWQDLVLFDISDWTGLPGQQ